MISGTDPPPPPPPHTHSPTPHSACLVLSAVLHPITLQARNVSVTSTNVTIEWTVTASHKMRASYHLRLYMKLANRTEYMPHRSGRDLLNPEEDKHSGLWSVTELSPNTSYHFKLEVLDDNSSAVHAEKILLVRTLGESQHWCEVMSPSEKECLLISRKLWHNAWCCHVVPPFTLNIWKKANSVPTLGGVHDFGSLEHIGLFWRSVNDWMWLISSGADWAPG